MHEFKNCIYCGKLNENRSKEHIIPESIGGKVWTKNCCKSCNNQFGTKFDSFAASFPIYTQFTDALEIGKKDKRGIPLKLQTPEGMKLSVQVSKEGLRVKGKTEVIGNTMLTDDIRIIKAAIKNGKKVISIEEKVINIGEVLSSKDQTYDAPSQEQLIGSSRKIILGLASLAFNEEDYFKITALLREGISDGSLSKQIRVAVKYKLNPQKIAHCLNISVDSGYLIFFLTMFGSFHICFSHPVENIGTLKETQIWVSPVINRYQIYENGIQTFDSNPNI